MTERNEMNSIEDKTFYNVNDVMFLLNCSKSKSYEIINTMNKELKNKNYYTVSGRVSTSYFRERMNI